MGDSIAVNSPQAPLARKGIPMFFTWDEGGRGAIEPGYLSQVCPDLVSALSQVCLRHRNHWKQAAYGRKMAPVSRKIKKL